MAETMGRKSRDNPNIRNFILQNVDAHQGDIASLVASRFRVSRVTANRYLDKLIADGSLVANGETKARTYSLKTQDERDFEFVVAGAEEHLVWRQTLAPLLSGESKNVLEMINNIIDHSGSERAKIHYKKNAAQIEIIIRDTGIGIFKKIANDCKLNDEREAILELAKGKLTTDPAKHTGEGIFFTSRMFTEFRIHSGRLVFMHERSDDGDWLIEIASQLKAGTAVCLKLDRTARYSTQDIFKKFEQDDEGVMGFSKTHVPVHLALYGNDQLVSRSQAKRVLARFNKFSEVMLDFKNVPTIGQAFADEIFRVFRNAHPDIKIIPVRTSPEVKAMIARVTAPSGEHS